jgi:arylsulfatase A-like enzyme
MNRRQFIKTTSVAALAASAGTSLCALTNERKSNIVIVLVDDLGWTDVEGLPNVKCPYPTPNIGHLAKSSMVFDNAYAACPVCSPTRASLITGKTPAALKITAHIPGKPGMVNKRSPENATLTNAEMLNQLPLEEVTFAELLKKDGYATAFFGKWHLAGIWTQPRSKQGAVKPEFHPDKQGFDINIGGCGYGMPPSYFSPYKNATIKDGPNKEYLPDRLTNEAIDFIKSKKDDPFLVYLNYYTVHTPFQAKPQMKAKMKAFRDPKQKTYAAMVASLDENIGRLMTALDELKLAENTLVIFTSDNGGLFPNTPLRGFKGEAWEGGIRVPFMVRWPGKIEAGTVNSAPIITYDLFPTIMAAAGSAQALPGGVEGENLMPLFTGKTTFKRRQPLFWHYPHFHHDDGPMAGMVRDGEWKLIYRYDTREMHLFNLEKDLSEKNNLASANPEKARELKTKLFTWLKAVDANMPQPKKN